MRTTAALCGLLIFLASSSVWAQPASSAAVSENRAEHAGSDGTEGWPGFAYKKRVGLWIKANIKPPSDPSTQIIAGTAEITIDLAPDGKITRARLSKSSGSRVWDDMVEQAVARAAKVPLDVDGRVPPQMIFEFSPR